ncbi:hypothetical protein BJX61DRAFT_87273 [Aspergillus egyptiacus]|nr:hypothetical protein BJX61DRAFT_87273 [Aspergillus egyptiacus]
MHTPTHTHKAHNPESRGTPIAPWDFESTFSSELEHKKTRILELICGVLFSLFFFSLSFPRIDAAQPRGAFEGPKWAGKYLEIPQTLGISPWKRRHPPLRCVVK